jgi:site-specific DNA-methyltransferase (adenine-specific)
MKEFPDGYFDLSVCDPPYGIGEDGSKNSSRGQLAKAKNYKGYIGNDKKPPDAEYFYQIKRISKNQIIFGANHFIENFSFIRDSSCWLVWDKQNGDSDFADCELAYTSFKTAVRIFRFKWQGMFQGDMKNKEVRIHGNQKPVALYDWIFKNYATEGMKILDTHLGSQSSRISAYKYKMDFTGYELDKYYFDQGCKRFDDFKSQLTLF